MTLLTSKVYIDNLTACFNIIENAWSAYFLIVPINLWFYILSYICFTSANVALVKCLESIMHFSANIYNQARKYRLIPKPNWLLFL